jgi:hypothetical protein
VNDIISTAVNDDNIDYVIVTGDFNDNQLDVNNVKRRNISMQYSLQQLVEDPTNFTEHSSSLIDLILLWILFFFLMSFLISFVNHAGSCFLLVTSLFGIVASAALKIVFEMSVGILSISSILSYCDR